jgi:sec-independent protein translocase protein TatB
MVIAPTIQVANLGMADSLILMVMALVVFGPRRLPQIGRQIGKLMYEFRKASNDFKFQMEEELRNAEEADRRKKEEEERQRQLAANPPAQIEASTSAATETAAATPEAAAIPAIDPPIDPRDPYAYTYGELTEEELRVQPTYPTIQPPSTGEPVPANRPTAEAAAAETAAMVQLAQEEAVQEQTAQEQSSPDQATPEIATYTKSTAVEDADKTIESATHNG